MSQDDFATYFVIFASAIVLYGIPILITVFLGIVLAQHWQMLIIQQRRLVVFLFPASVLTSFILAFPALALSLSYVIFDVLLFFLALIAIPALILILIFLGSLIHRFENDTNRLKLSFILICVFLLSSFTYYPFMSDQIVNTCHGIHQREVQPLIQAMEVYRLDNGFYPEDTSALSPNYIQQIPEPMCLKPHAWLSNHLDLSIPFPNYTILRCENDLALVMVSSPDVGAAQFYNSSTKVWGIMDYYDITCNDIE